MQTREGIMRAKKTLWEQHVVANERGEGISWQGPAQFFQYTLKKTHSAKSPGSQGADGLLVRGIQAGTLDSVTKS